MCVVKFEVENFFSICVVNFEVENFEVENFEVEHFEVENFEVEHFRYIFKLNKTGIDHFQN